MDPPDEEITLLEAEELVAERLKILKLIERLKERYKFMSPNFKEAFTNVGFTFNFLTGFM